MDGRVVRRLRDGHISRPMDDGMSGFCGSGCGDQPFNTRSAEDNMAVDNIVDVGIRPHHGYS